MPVSRSRFMPKSYIFAFCILLLTAPCGCGGDSQSENSPNLDTVSSPKKTRHVPIIDFTDNNEVFFEEQFRSPKSLDHWIVSKAKRPDTSEELAQYDGKWAIEVPSQSAFDNDYSLAMKSPARHHAIAARLSRPFDFAHENRLVVQYEVKFGKSPECSGAYMKLLFDDSDLDNFNSKSDYTIMFGPDKCGMTQKCHFIVRFENPKTHEFSEHSGSGNVSSSIFGDQQTHVFRLELTGDKYRVLIDDSVADKGNLLKDLTPPIIPDEVIDDPEDFKPEDWDDRKEIVDERAVKPDDWNEDEPLEIIDETQSKPDYWLDDEPTLIPDLTAKKPDDHDVEVDGVWEPPLVDNEKCMREGQNICGEWKPPMVPNPKYRGKWRPPMIDNPNYKGEWSPRKINNPAHFELDKPVFSQLHSIKAIGLELWSLTENIYFDNFIISNSPVNADQFLNKHWKEKSKAEIPKGLSRFEALMYQASKRPFVSASIVIGIFFALIAIIGKLTQSSKTDKRLGEAKKTDEPTLDDEGNEMEPIAEIIDVPDSQTSVRSRSRGRRSGEDEDSNAQAEGDAEKGLPIKSRKKRSSSRKRSQNSTSSADNQN